MAELASLPEPVKKAQRSLETYVKKRQEAAHVRRILAAHLSAHVSPAQGTVSRPLSLAEATSIPESATHGVKGIQKEYLRCLRANAKARKGYAKLSKEHHSRPEYHQARSNTQDLSDSKYEAGLSIDPFLDLVEKRQKHERLHIIQDYVDMLGEKPAAATMHLDTKAVLKDVGALPQVPPEVMSVTSIQQGTGGRDLKELVGHLEKSVLRAKMLLKREQKLLAKVQAANGTSAVIGGNKLQALGATRNELINWIESELTRAGENSPEDEEISASASPESGGKEYIDSQLASVQRQYSRYTKARQALIMAVTGNLDPPALIAVDDCKGKPAGKDSQNGANGLVYIAQPYLEEMVLISNEQKAMIQQKSYLSISLAKQLKEGGQGLDRLAEESHLLAAHPMRTAKFPRKGLEGPVSFGDEISGHEKPDSSRRARTWVFAAESVGITTRDAISEKLEDGGMAMLDAQETLLELLCLLGNDVEEEDLDNNATYNPKEGVGRAGDIWATLDGSLGVIQRDDGDV
jgi:hypothetical protein